MTATATIGIVGIKRGRQKQLPRLLYRRYHCFWFETPLKPEPK